MGISSFAVRWKGLDEIYQVKFPVLHGDQSEFGNPEISDFPTRRPPAASPSRVTTSNCLLRRAEQQRDVKKVIFIHRDLRSESRERTAPAPRCDMLRGRVSRRRRCLPCASTHQIGMSAAAHGSGEIGDSHERSPSGRPSSPATARSSRHGISPGA